MNFRLLVSATVGLTVALSTAVTARDLGAGIGYSPRADLTYCSTILTSNDPASRINVRKGAGTDYPIQHYGVTGEWVDFLNEGGNPNRWRTRTDANGDQWYQVGFPKSRAYGWVREDFVALPPRQCRN